MQIRLEIQDYGQGMPAETLRQVSDGAGKTGVGVAGMRERVRELGGYMTIQSDSRGTQLAVVLPLGHPSELSPKNAEYQKQDHRRLIPKAFSANRGPHSSQRRFACLVSGIVTSSPMSLHRG